MASWLAPAAVPRIPRHEYCFAPIFTGFAWYDYTLVDTDVAINAMMWQMGHFHGNLRS